MVEPELGLEVTDADNSPSAVRIMGQRHSGLDKYSCVEADALELPFADGSFDAVLDKGTLDGLLCRSEGDARAMIAEAHRVLPPGGVFLQVRALFPPVTARPPRHCGRARSALEHEGSGSGLGSMRRNTGLR